MYTPVFRSTFLLIVVSFFIVSCAQHSEDQAAPKVTAKVNVDTTIVTTEMEQSTTDPPKINTTALPTSRDQVSISLPGKEAFSVSVMKGYSISVAATGMGRLRFLSKSPDGRIFGTDMKDRSDNKEGKVYIFENWNEEEKRFMTHTTFLSGLHNPNQVAFYKNYIYVAETGRLIRYPYKAGANALDAALEVLATFPDYGLSYKYGGWHLTRSLAFHHDKLYVSVGSSCNACIEKEDVRASVLQMDPDGKNSKIFASGLRNSVGIGFIGDQLWATSMGRDLIGGDKPEDLFEQVEEGKNYGWPFYYQYKQKIYEDVTMKDSAKSVAREKPPVAFQAFRAHSSPLAFALLQNFSDPALDNAVLVCLHGSNSAGRHRGNEVVKIRGGNEYEPVVTGFLQGDDEKGRLGRPCGILQNDSKSFFFTDDLNGVLYYVYKEK